MAQLVTFKNLAHHTVKIHRTDQASVQIAPRQSETVDMEDWPVQRDVHVLLRQGFICPIAFPEAP